MRRQRLVALISACVLGAMILASPVNADGTKSRKSADSPKANPPNVPYKADKDSKKSKPSKRSTEKQTAAKAESNPPNKSPENLAIIGMKKLVVEADIRDMTFEDFAEWIGRDTGASVIVRWKLIEKEGISRESKIFVKAKDVSISQLLAMAFLHLTQGKPGVELSAHADGNTLLISTRKDINSKMMTRVYDAEDLIQDIPNFEQFGVERENTRTSKRRASARMVHARPGQEISPQILELIDSITLNIDPESWKVAGGKGRIRYFKGKLIIYNTIEVHQKIGGVIEGGQ